MNERLFGIRELENVILRTLEPISSNGILFEKGEKIASFDKIQIVNFTEDKSYTTANGGYDNRAHVFWEETKSVRFSLVQGIFSKDQFGIFHNAKLYRSKEEKIPILISRSERIESNEEGVISLKCPPVGDFFIYDAKTGEKIKIFEKIDCCHYKIFIAFMDVVVDYKIEYCKCITTMTIGQPFLEGFLELEGKFKTVDDITGQVKTGIIKVPKLKLLNEFSMTVGQQASPISNQLNALALPVGEKRNKEAIKIFFLEDDIDSDM